MLPRATVRDPSPVRRAARPLGRLAWWRSRNLATFATGHCLTAGVLQLLALVADLGRAGRPMPGASALAWAAIGLALIAAIPASLTLALRVTRPAAPPRAHVRQAAAMAVIFYGVLPWFVLGGSLGAVATLLPVALAWHLVLAAAPVAPDAGPSRPGDLTAD